MGKCYPQEIERNAELVRFQYIPFFFYIFYSSNHIDHMIGRLTEWEGNELKPRRVSRTGSIPVSTIIFLY